MTKNKILAWAFSFSMLILLAGLFVFKFILHPTTPRRGINVIVFWIDTLRHDHMSSYEYDRVTSPMCAKLAREGALFTQCISASSWTRPAGISLLTSQWVSTHGVQMNYARDDLVFISEILKKYSYKTFASVQTPLYAPKSGFKQGFDRYDYPIKKGISLDEFHKLIYYPNSKINAWIEKNRNCDFFMWIHMFYPHGPYAPPEPFNLEFTTSPGTPHQDPHAENTPNGPYSKSSHETENLSLGHIPIGKEYHYGYRRIPFYQNLDGRTDLEYYISQYDGEILFTDTQIRAVCEKLKELGILDNTIIVIAADHAESLGENEYYFVHSLLYDSVIRIPLIIRYPPKIPARTVIDYQVRSIDVCPTILELLNIPLNDEAEGLSLLPFISGDEQYDRDALSTSHSKAGGFISPSRVPEMDIISIRSRIDETFWKFIYYPHEPLSSTEHELYNLTLDPEENRNLIQERTDIISVLETRLESMVKQNAAQERSGKKIKYNRKAEELLKSLGYIGTPAESKDSAKKE